MWNPHPPLSGFPFVLVVLLALSELCAVFGTNGDTRRKNSAFLLICAAIFIPLTYYSGYFGADFASNTFVVPEDAMLEHQLWAKAALFLFLGSALVFALTRAVDQNNPGLRQKLSLVYRLLLIILLAVLARASFLGGELVFSHGAGLKHAPETPKKAE